MSAETTGDMSLIQDEDLLQKMCQEAEDFDKKKEVRSHMYKVREARLKDFYNSGEETTSSSDNRQYSTSTTSTTKSSNIGLKGSDLMMHADNLADHSFLSLKSKEIRDSESPTKDSYKITESRKFDDRDWNVIESNEASKDGKTHTTSRLATTSGKQNLDGGELNYAAKSEQKASVYKDGDDKNFKKAVEASSQNVIKQEAFGGDDNNKFHSTSTTTTSSSKFTNEQRSSTDDFADYTPVTAHGERPSPHSSAKTSQTVVRKVYTDNIPNELKNNPRYIDGNTKVTTETKTLPDGSTVTTTRYETKGATEYSTSSTSSATTSSKKHASSNEQSSSNIIKNRVITEDTGRDFDDRCSVISDSSIRDDKSSSNTTKIVRSKQIDSKSFVDKSDVTSNISENRFVNERDVKRIHDQSLIGRDTKNVQNIDVFVKSHELPVQDAQTYTTITKNIQTTYHDQPVRDTNDTDNSTTIIKTFTIPSQDSHTTTTKVSKTISSKYDKQQVASTDFLNTERKHVTETKTSTTNIEDIPIVANKEPIREVTEVIKEIRSITPKSTPIYKEPRDAIQKPRDSVEVEIITTTEEYVKRDEPKYDQTPYKEPVSNRKPSHDTFEIEIIPAKERPRNEVPIHEQPERRQPIKPGKSEFDEIPTPTEGQYETTYRSEYIPKRISVEVSPTHDAFARSLRSISPDRLSKTGSVRSIRTTSTTSLRSTSSPDKHATKPGKVTPTSSRPLSPTKKHTKSPEKYHGMDIVTKKRPESPEKKSPDHSHRVVGKYNKDEERTTKQTHSSHTVNTDTITRRKKTTNNETEVDSSTLTRKKHITEKPRSRSVSPTSVASDIEFIRHGTEIVTDLDVDETNKRSIQDTKFTRRHTEEFDRRSNIVETTDTRKTQKITDKSATLPLPDSSIKKTPSSPSKDSPKSRTPIKEPNVPSSEKPNNKNFRRTDTYQQRCEEILGISDVKDDDEKPSLFNIPRGTDQSPTKPKKVPETDIAKPKETKPSTQDVRKSPEKQKPVQEFPSQAKKIPVKEPVDKTKSIKQIPGREPSKPSSSEPEASSPARKSPVKESRKPTQKESTEARPDRPKHDNYSPSVKEFPSQVRKSPIKERLEPYPEKPKGDKTGPSVQEFPAQIRKSPVKEPLEPYPEKTKSEKSRPSVKEFPSQVRKSPVKEPLEPYPEKPKDEKSGPSVQEFPSQTRKSPVKEPLEPYPQKPKGDKTGPSVQEFPAQIKKSPVKEPLEPYPEKPKEVKSSPSVQEFPSQTRRLPDKEPLEPYPEKPTYDKQAPSVQEFPSQIRKPPQKEPLEPYPEKPKYDKEAPTVQEFPSQIRKSPQKEPLEPYPEKPKYYIESPTVQEFPAQIRRSPQKEPLEPYSEKPKHDKQTPSVQEFPSQIRKSPQKEPLEPYPEKSTSDKEIPSIQEFPSQKRLPEKEPSLAYPERPKSEKKVPSSQDIPSQIKKPLEKQPSENLPDRSKSIKQTPSAEKPIGKLPERQKTEPRQDKPKETKHIPSPVNKPESEYPTYYPDKSTNLIDKPLEKTSNKVSLDDLPNIKTDKVSLDDLPSTLKPDRKSPEKISLHDLDYKPNEIVDSFITNEKVDTEITLKKYKDNSIHAPRGIPDNKMPEKVIKKTTKLEKKIKKDTISSSIVDDETDETTEEEEDDDILNKVEDEIIEDVCDIVKCVDGRVTDEKVTKVTETQQTKKPVKEEPKTDKKQSSPVKLRPKTQKPREVPVEDFITVTKTQLLQTESKMPIEEPVHKKFISVLCKDEEEDRIAKQTISTEKQIRNKNIVVDESPNKPNKTVKKDNPDKTGPINKLPDRKKQTELLIKKEKLDTNIKSKVDTRRIDAKISPKGTPKKTPDDNKTIIRRDTEKKVYHTEYTDEYSSPKDKRVNKPISRVSTPIKQTRKIVSQEISNTIDTSKDTKLHIKIEKDTTTKKASNLLSLKTSQIDRKPISKRPVSPYKKPEDQQPKQPTKLKTSEVKQPRTIVRTTLQKTVEVQPAKRHVVSTIINIKPKTKPETITKTIHKTTVTRTITAPKTNKPKSTKPKQKHITNGYISTEEDDSDIEIIKDTDHPIRETKKPVKDHISPARKSPITKHSDTSDKRKHCITTKSILIENAVADQREIIVDLKRSKSSREGTPDRICPYPVNVDADLGSPRYPDRVTEPEERTYYPKPKKISDIPISETEHVSQFDRLTEVTENTVNTIKAEVESTDECLLSVNEKVSKFLSTAEQVTKKPGDMKPAPKVERPKLEVDDTLKEDECLLSVSDKVQKFLTTAEQLTVNTKDGLQRSKSPKPNQNQSFPKTPVDEYVPKTKEEVRYTSELNKTINTDERLYSRASVSPEKIGYPLQPKSRESKSPEYSEIDSVRYRTPERKSSDLYAKKMTEEIVKTRKESFEDDGTPKTSKRLSKDESKTVLSPTGRLRSTETIKKAKALFENIAKDKEPVKQKDILSRPSIFEARKVKKTEEISQEKKEKDVRTKLTYDEVKRSPSPTKQSHSKIRSREQSPDREIPHYMIPLEKKHRDIRPKLIHDDSDSSPSPPKHSQTKTKSREESPDREIPHYMIPLEKTHRDVRPKSIHDEIDSSPSPPKHSQTKTKSREQSPDREIPHYMTPLEKKHKDVRAKLTYDEFDRSLSPPKHSQTKIRSRDQSPDGETPHYMTPLDRTVKEHIRRKKYDDRDSSADVESINSRDTTPDRNIPHYMLPLDRSIRERSPHKDNLKEIDDIMNKSFGTTNSDEVDVKATKFGVTLRRTDSGRVISANRKSSTSSIDKQTIELEIEEIVDLDYLEKLLETIVGYDIRRRIRAQIRVIKRAIEENTFERLISSKRTSPTKDSPKRQPVDKDEPILHVKRYSNVDRRRQSQESTSVTEVSEYKSSYQRKTSSEFSSTIKSSSPIRDRSPKKLKDKSISPDRKSRTPDVESIERKPSTTTTTSRIFQTDLKKIKPVTKNVVDDKPEWVTQRMLRKVSETSAPVKKTITTTVKKVVTRKENENAKPTDVITSSYGVGPTDENGTPLFGLKALRTQNKSEKMKVQGTVIQSQYYSENGDDPHGEISVTKYSTDPSDLGTENVSQNKGISSVTTTQRFGYKGTPSLQTVASKTKKTSGEEEYKSSTKTSKVTRRGSVKEISQKFIENAVDTLKNERQSSYPKAGLILRTSSFKDAPSNETDSSREGSPATQEMRQKVITTIETTSTTSGDKKANTFLTNKSRVTGVQDTISRMKTQDVEIEESEEDAEARNLLNKFIGSQVLLSGMESHVSKSPVTMTTTPSGGLKRTTKVTTTTTTSESSKPTTITRTFTHPITAELLETIWDEQTLKLLLEQSTDYEDRRIIRARLREVMAEQEACAELVEKASDEVAMKESGSTVHGTTTRTYTEGPVTSASQVTTRITSQQQQIKKPMSPFAKFRQLDKQNSLNSPPSTPKSPTCGGPLFKFTDPTLNQSANTIKQRLLQWCQMKTKEYENIQLDNFSTSWADGMAFCALIHHFLPDAFDYNALNPRNRRHNFTLAFRVADEKAGIFPLLDVDDMVAISKPDWKCVFTYVQSVYRRFKDED